MNDYDYFRMITMENPKKLSVESQARNLFYSYDKEGIGMITKKALLSYFACNLTLI